MARKTRTLANIGFDSPQEKTEKNKTKQINGTEKQNNENEQQTETEKGNSLNEQNNEIVNVKMESEQNNKTESNVKMESEQQNQTKSKNRIKEQLKGTEESNKNNEIINDSYLLNSNNEHNNETVKLNSNSEQTTANEDLLSIYNEEKPRVEDTHTRDTYLIRNDLLERFNNVARTQKKGFKMRLINHILEKELDRIDPEGAKGKGLKT